MFVGSRQLDPARGVPLGAGHHQGQSGSAEGAPSGGTITFAIQVNSVTEDITFPCPCTIAQTITALEGHSEIDTGDVTVTGGTLPNATQKLVFANNPVIVNAINALTKTWAAEPGYYWEPC